MQWSLFLLILMGHCSFFTCHVYEYHFITEKKTCDEAQSYCREKHTDLAIVFDMTDMKRLCDSRIKECDSKNHDDAWIGLYNEPGKGNRMWHWSLPGVEFNDSETKWAEKEPNDKGEPENCVRMDNGTWRDVPCTSQYNFICYDERKQSNETFCLIQKEMNWTQAQNYCRQNHTDLVSGLSQLENLPNDIKSKNNLWIGLFRDTWRWSDGRNFSFRNWDPEFFSDKQGKKKCATTVSDGLKWGSDDCSEKKPFFCYDDKVILIKENKTWTEALYYCREKHYDLISITNLAEQWWVQEWAKNASTDFVWLGLRYTCTLDFWFWISDEQVDYKNWASEEKMDDCDMSAAMEKEGEHKWHKKADESKFNFICTRF